jgi:hypothetical protein
MKKSLCLVLIASFLAAGLNAQNAEPSNPAVFSLYGFGRANYFWDNKDMGRTDLFIPANIKVGVPTEPNFFIGAKQTRIGLDIVQPFGSNALAIKIEGDFHNDASNSIGMFRMRHAYANYKWILVGMTWSNFFDIDVNPVVVDFEGPNSSTLLRTPQIKFSTYGTNNTFSISFENSIEQIQINDSISVLPIRFPDIVGAFKRKGDFGFVKIAGLVRELRYKSDMARSLLSYGVTVMTAINLPKKDKLRFQFVGGTGVASYIEGTNGLNYDAVYNGTNTLDALFIVGTNISYQHFWRDTFYSSITGGFLSASQNANLSPTDYKLGYYGSINTFWQVVPNFVFGAEVVAGQRVNFDNSSGTAFRFQLNATYSFKKVFSN